jgi:carbamoyl-phosphate synthase large subunit
VLATGGTQRFLAENSVEATKINKVLEGRLHIEDAIRNRHRATLMQKVPHCTTLAGAEGGKFGG